MRARSAWIRAGLVLAAVIVLDQITKRMVIDSIMPGETRNVLPGVHLEHARNDGVAFGFLPGSHALVLVIVASALLGLLVYFALHSTRTLVWLPTGLLIGGALGNILDRIREGSVTDFVKLPLWPPFNLADTAITVGVLSLIYVLEGPRSSSPRSRAGSGSRD